VDPISGESFLLLEDLAPAQTGNWLAGATALQLDLALQAAARLHAAWWQGSPEDVLGLAHLVQNVSDEQNLVEQLYAEAWPRFVDHAPFEIPSDVRQFGERLQGRIATAEALLENSPHTLAHGDFRVDNMLFSERDGQPTCWVIDWEDILLWNGTLDVAWFLGSCLRVQDIDQEQSLLRRYHQALLEQGVAGYSWDQCAYDYRCAMLSCFVQGILSAIPPEANNTYAHSLAHAIGERFVTVPSRLALGKLMPA
jgi:aminoglycoside/choline kinase family phosphotransferase